MRDYELRSGPKKEYKAKALTDLDEMPFGKHKGTPMQDVPASYFHYLWINGMEKEDKPVANYIRENLEALKKDHPDGIW